MENVIDNKANVKAPKARKSKGLRMPHEKLGAQIVILTVTIFLLGILVFAFILDACQLV